MNLSEAIKDNLSKFAVNLMQNRSGTSPDCYEVVEEKDFSVIIVPRPRKSFPVLGRVQKNKRARALQKIANSLGMGEEEAVSVLLSSISSEKV